MCFEPRRKATDIWPKADSEISSKAEIQAKTTSSVLDIAPFYLQEILAQMQSASHFAGATSTKEQHGRFRLKRSRSTLLDKLYPPPMRPEFANAQPGYYSVYHTIPPFYHNRVFTDDSSSSSSSTPPA